MRFVHQRIERKQQLLQLRADIQAHLLSMMVSNKTKTTFPEPRPASPVHINHPRNGLCPCGSGKKYKKCCRG